METEPKQMPRPTDADIAEKMYYIEQAKNGGGDFDAYIEEVREFAGGGGDADTKEQFYPGWTKEDFQRLLEELEAKGLI